MCSNGQNSNIETVYITQDERDAGEISALNLQSAVTQFHRNGLVILENAIPLSALHHVRCRMLEDIPRNIASPHAHYNQGREHKNLSQTPPLDPEYLHEEIWVNHFAVAVVEHIIGPRPQLSYATSNIALPGGQGRQAVHSDYYCSHLDFPVFLEVCIFLGATSSQNGSTEVWPRTHRGYNKRDHAFADTGWIKQEVFRARARTCPPIQPFFPKGSLIIRDLRLWHAGMANSTSVPRIMLGFIYSPKWFRSHMRLRFPLKARPRVESWTHVDCLSISEFVDDEFDYLEFRQDLNLTQENTHPISPHVPKHGSFMVGPEHYWSGVDGQKELHF
jgi:ectoine hydroxylase-related dioxygenase (phytanoyl-CoA dioxygenase family)